MAKTTPPAPSTESAEPTTESAATPTVATPEPPAEPAPDPTLVEITSDAPGNYPGLGLVIAKRGSYTPSDAARILAQGGKLNRPGFAQCSQEDRARLRKLGFLDVPARDAR